MAVRIAVTWLDNRARYLPSTGLKGFGGVPPPGTLRSVPCLGMMTLISRRSCRGGLGVSAIGLYSLRPSMGRCLGNAEQIGECSVTVQLRVSVTEHGRNGMLILAPQKR